LRRLFYPGCGKERRDKAENIKEEKRGKERMKRKQKNE
jgi:hypothetical protein